MLLTRIIATASPNFYPKHRFGVKEAGVRRYEEPEHTLCDRVYFFLTLTDKFSAYLRILVHLIFRYVAFIGIRMIHTEVLWPI